MIEILLMEDRERETELLREIETKGGKARILLMTDGEDELGYVMVELMNDRLIIHEMKTHGYCFDVSPAAEHYFIMDSLMRAAASYGETNGMDRIETSFPDFFDFFKKHGFETDNEHAFTAIGTIIHYS